MRETAAQYVQGNNNDVVIDVSGEPVVGYWCRASMQRALENLVNNAIKYGAAILSRSWRNKRGDG